MTGSGAGVGGDWAKPIAAQPSATTPSTKPAKPYILFISIPPGLRAELPKA
jgi:hypothetical protein